MTFSDRRCMCQQDGCCWLTLSVEFKEMNGFASVKEVLISCVRFETCRFCTPNLPSPVTLSRHHSRITMEATRTYGPSTKSATSDSHLTEAYKQLGKVAVWRCHSTLLGTLPFNTIFVTASEPLHEGLVKEFGESVPQALIVSHACVLPRFYTLTDYIIVEGLQILCFLRSKLVGHTQGLCVQRQKPHISAYPKDGPQQGRRGTARNSPND